MSKSLSSDVLSTLSAWRCSAGEVDDDGFAAIYDEDGDFLVAVPHDITSQVVAILLRYGAHRYLLGRRVGAEQAKAEIRSALGLEPTP